MMLRFKITEELLGRVRSDLNRPHAFAFERVGWISAGLAQSGEDLIATAKDYRPVSDADYIRDDTVGAMMNSNAIRAALEWSYQTRSSIFHVHMHHHRGSPVFSPTDRRESAKFVPDFFHVRPELPHGAILLSADSMIGLWWPREEASGIPITNFTVVGARISRFGGFEWRG